MQMTRRIPVQPAEDRAYHVTSFNAIALSNVWLVREVTIHGKESIPLLHNHNPARVFRTNVYDLSRSNGEHIRPSRFGVIESIPILTAMPPAGAIPGVFAGETMPDQKPIARYTTRPSERKHRRTLANCHASPGQRQRWRCQHCRAAIQPQRT